MTSPTPDAIPALSLPQEEPQEQQQEELLHDQDSGPRDVSFQLEEAVIENETSKSSIREPEDGVDDERGNHRPGDNFSKPATKTTRTRSRKIAPTSSSPYCSKSASSSAPKLFTANGKEKSGWQANRNDRRRTTKSTAAGDHDGADADSDGGGSRASGSTPREMNYESSNGSSLSLTSSSDDNAKAQNDHDNRPQPPELPCTGAPRNKGSGEQLKFVLRDRGSKSKKRSTGGGHGQHHARGTDVCGTTGAGKKNKKSSPHKPSHPQHRRSKPATSGRTTARGHQHGSNKPSSTTASNRHDHHKNTTNKEDDFTIAMRYLVKAPIRAARFCFSEIFEGSGVFLEEDEEDFYKYRKNTGRTRRRTTSRGRSTSERRAAPRRAPPRIHRRMNKQEPSSSPEITTSKRGGGRAGNREDDVDRNRKLRFDEENKRRNFNADESTGAPPAPLRLGLTDDEQSFLMKHKNEETISFQMPGGGQEDPINLDRSGFLNNSSVNRSRGTMTNSISTTSSNSFVRRGAHDNFSDDPAAASEISSFVDLQLAAVLHQRIGRILKQAKKRTGNSSSSSASRTTSDDLQKEDQKARRAVFKILETALATACATSTSASSGKKSASTSSTSGNKATTFNPTRLQFAAKLAQIQNKTFLAFLLHVYFDFEPGMGTSSWFGNVQLPYFYGTSSYVGLETGASTAGRSGGGGLGLRCTSSSTSASTNSINVKSLVDTLSFVLKDRMAKDRDGFFEDENNVTVAKGMLRLFAFCPLDPWGYLGYCSMTNNFKTRARLSLEVRAILLPLHSTVFVEEITLTKEEDHDFIRNSKFQTKDLAAGGPGPGPAAGVAAAASSHYNKSLPHHSEIGYLTPIPRHAESLNMENDDLLAPTPWTPEEQYRHGDEVDHFHDQLYYGGEEEEVNVNLNPRFQSFFRNNVRSSTGTNVGGKKSQRGNNYKVCGDFHHGGRAGSGGSKNYCNNFNASSSSKKTISTNDNTEDGVFDSDDEVGGLRGLLPKKMLQAMQQTSSSSEEEDSD
ncbi:unnamed protein product [Amoebophrya sp. A120]|nr:unnamed protein product [Amoebophrya sp. A120]|eukprot:GSA120T00014335001.1